MSEPDQDASALARLIDHTILKPDAAAEQVLACCEEATLHGFRSVCINPVRVKLVAATLAGSDVRTCSVIGFPLGAATSRIKAAEAAQAVADGADEIDMVIDIGALKEGRHDVVGADIAAVRAACPDAILKVIIETCLLDDDEKRMACRLAKQSGADFVKTSTGFSSSGATRRRRGAHARRSRTRRGRQGFGGRAHPGHRACDGRRRSNAARHQLSASPS